MSFLRDEDYTVYLDRLKEYAKKYGVQIHAYVLMTNHVHLLVTPDTLPQIYLHRAPVDFRKQANGLTVLVEQELGHNPFTGALCLYQPTAE